MRYDSSSKASEVSQWLQEAPPSEDLAASVEEVQSKLHTSSTKNHEHGLTLL